MSQKPLHFFYQKPYAWVIGAIVLTLALAINQLGFRSLWWDEAYSIYFAKMDWSKLWILIINGEANQSLYFILLKLWVSFGNDEFTVRLPSVIFAVASIPIIFLVGRKLIDTRGGVIAAFLLGVNGFFIYYAQEARGYSLLLFLTLCSSYFAIKSVQSPSRKSWIGFIIFSVLATYVHFFAIWVLLAHACTLPFLPRNRINWKNLFYVSLIIIVCLLPLLIFILTNKRGQISWIIEPTYLDVAYLFYSFTGWPIHLVSFNLGFIYASTYLILCIIPIKYLYRICKEHGISLIAWRQVFISSWFFLPIVFVFCASMFKPMFKSHYLIISLPGFILLTTISLTKINHKWISLLSSILLILTTAGFTIKSYKNYPKEDWRGMAQTVASLSKDQDAILFYKKEARVPFNYYLTRFNSNQKTFHFANNYLPYLGSTPNKVINEELIKDLSNRHKRIWLILSHSQGHSEEKEIKTLMSKYFIEKKYWSFHYLMHVHFYVSKDT